MDYWIVIASSTKQSADLSANCFNRQLNQNDTHLSFLFVLKGQAGNPSPLYKFKSSGLSAQPYLTYFGLLMLSFQTTILFFQ